MTVRRAVLGLALLAVVAIAGLWWRAVWVTRQLLRVDAPAAVAEKSGNVYQVAVGRVRFNPASRRVTVDTIHVTTDSAANAARPRPRAGLRLSFQECTISGVRVFKLIFRQGLDADTFGCSAVTAAVNVPRGGPDSAGPSDDAERAFYALQQSLRLPASAPQVRVARIDFPQVALDFRLQRARGEARLQLEHLRWLMTGFLIDPRDSTAAARPLFSDTVEIAAANFVGQLDSVTAVKVEALRLSLSDSTLEIRDVSFEPSQSDSAFARSHPYRRTLIRTETSRIAVHGLDVGVFLLRQGVRARRVQLDSLRMDVFSDHRRPKHPRRPPRLTPQRWIAGIERGIRVDTVLIRGGEIAYREHRPRHPKPGVMTFARLEAVATNVRHVVGRRTTRDPLTLYTTAYLQNQAKLDAQFSVPLDAPGFTMTFRGKLGAMPATSFNAFVEETFPMRLDKGQVAGITFEARVTNGVARGALTPRYKDLAVEVTGEGSKGILSTGGVIGEAARGVATFVGNLTELRSDNPEDGETAPRVGTINHTFTPDQTLPAFLWKSIRSGLLAVVRK
jgi:hypothetical protein